jgi:hypothetical protein
MTGTDPNQAVGWRCTSRMIAGVEFMQQLLNETVKAYQRSLEIVAKALAGFNLFSFLSCFPVHETSPIWFFVVKQRFTSPWTRELWVMRKQFGMAAQWIVLPLLASLASCQSGRSAGNAGSRTEITDPNTAFSQGGASANSATGPTSGNSSRRGRGLFGGSDGGN